MTKHLTEKDLKDGKELMQILENLREEDRKQVIIYASALKDRQLIESSKKAGQEEMETWEIGLWQEVYG